jgi:hypothetical protein
MVNRRAFLTAGALAVPVLANLDHVVDSVISAGMRPLGRNTAFGSARGADLARTSRRAV